MRARALAAVVGAALLLGSAGCGSGVDAAAEADRAAGSATVHGGAAGDEVILPVNAFGYTVPDRDKLGLARQILTDTCMRRLGYPADLAADEARLRQVSASDVADHGTYGNKRRYVITDAATATEYGYHLVSSVTAAPSAHQHASPRTGATTAAAQQALTGMNANGRPVTRTADGTAIPAGGCVGEADGALAASGRVGEADPVSTLDSASYQHSLHDPEVLAAFTAWSACMAHRGYHIVSPVSATDGFDLDTPTVSRVEIATAQADVACKQQTGLIDIWFQSEAAYQEAGIRKQASRFHQAGLEHDAAMKAVTGILASH